ncbi:MAG: hypothetical protein NWE88_09930 [Candidatus Bathyarchaeota archaeon]|nr:hypothetical protein [Candidatus Bathyarchaeota archaeon]
MKIVDLGTFEWADPPRGYYLSDVKEKVLWRDEETVAIFWDGPKSEVVE